MNSSVFGTIIQNSRDIVNVKFATDVKNYHKLVFKPSLVFLRKIFRKNLVAKKC